MSKSQSVTGFCVFCYQSIYNCAKAANSSESVNKFTKCVDRLTMENRIYKLFRGDGDPDTLVNFKLQSCYECNIIIDGFCNYFLQFEVLQLQMKWKLEQIGGIINHCNRIPSRWRKMTAAVEETFPDDMESRLKTLKFIRNYRQTIEKTCRQINQQKQPRVLLKPNIHFNTNYKSMRQFNLQSEIEEENDNNVVIQDNTTSVMSISDMEIDTDNEEHVEYSNQKEYAASLDPLKQIKLETCLTKPVSDEDNIAVQKDQDYNTDTADSTENYIQIDSSITKPSSTYQQQRYSLRHNRKSVKVMDQVENTDYDNSDDEFVPETNSENMSSDNDTEASEKKENQLSQDTSSSSGPKSTAVIIINKNSSQCPNCEKHFTNFRLYATHLKSKVCKDANTGTSKCKECDLLCNTKRELWRHRNEDHEDVICRECGKLFRRTRELNTHLEYHKDPTEWKFECWHCGKKCASKYSLRQHISVSHEDNQIKPANADTSLMEQNPTKPKPRSTKFSCPNCCRKFRSNHVHKNHLMSQLNGKFQCEFCPHVDSNVIKLSTHEYQSHCPDDIKEQDRVSSRSNQSFQWTCPRCQYKSTCIADYQFHFAQVHFKLRGTQLGTKCFECKKTFQNTTNLKEHIKKIHPDYPSQIWTCKKWYASELYLDSLKKNKHSSTSNLESNIAKKKRNIEELKKSGFNTESKICEICGHVLACLNSKIRHLKKIHGLPGTTDKSKHFNCQVDGCTAYFLTVGQLAYHRVAKHKYKLNRSKIPVARKKLKAKRKVDLELYKCPKCNKSFQGLKIYGRHKSSKFCSQNSTVNVDHEKVNCEECNLMCDSKLELWQHQSEEHEDPVCLQCGKIFSTRKQLAKHLVYHKDPKDWECECYSCGRKFPEKGHLKKHIERLHGKDGENSKQIYTKSIEKANEVYPKQDTRSPKRRFRCKNCNKIFRKEQVYQNHLYSQHKDKFQCEFCPHVDANVIKLSSHEYQSHCSDETREQDQHLKISSKSTYWSCPRCKHRSTNCADYQFHFAQTHFKIKDLKCEKAVVVKHTIQKWTKKVISGGGKCEKCGKVFATKQYLYQHNKRAHPVSQVTLTCEKCGKEFSWMGYLKQHLELHKEENEWKWQCSKCGRKFVRNRGLQAHMISHSKKKLFKCKICGDKFKYVESLKNHIKAKHKSEDLMQDDAT